MAHFITFGKKKSILDAWADPGWGNCLP